MPAPNALFLSDLEIWVWERWLLGDPLLCRLGALAQSGAGGWKCGQDTMAGVGETMARPTAPIDKLV